MGISICKAYYDYFFESIFRALLILLLSFSTIVCTAQSKMPLKEVNNRLNFIYSHVFENIDTTDINFRKECNELIQLGNKQMQSTGYRTLGLLDMYANKYNNSITEFKKAIALDSACFICYRKLHWTYWYQKNDYGSATSLWRTATKQFENVLKEDSAEVNNWQRLYIMYSLNEGALSKTIKNRMTYIARKIVALDSANAYYWWQYSFHQEDDKKAQEYSLRKAFTLSPATDIYWNALTDYYSEQKNIIQLKQVLEDVMPAKDEDREYWYQQKAHYYFEAGLKKEAADIAKEAKSKGFNIVYK